MAGSVAYVGPRLLTAKQGAAYFNLPVTTFERLGIGRVCFGAKILYDRAALDAYLDEQSGLAHPGADSNADDPEAALERFTSRFANASRRP